MKKLLLTLIAPALLLANTPVHATTSVTTTASISFYDSHPTGQFTKSGQPIPSVQYINYKITSLTFYTVKTWRDMPLINLFTKHDYKLDFYGLKFQTMDGKTHQVKLNSKEAALYINNSNNPVTLTWHDNTLYVNNQKTKLIANNIR